MRLHHEKAGGNEKMSSTQNNAADRLKVDDCGDGKVINICGYTDPV